MNKKLISFQVLRKICGLNDDSKGYCCGKCCKSHHKCTPSTCHIWKGLSAPGTVTAHNSKSTAPTGVPPVAQCGQRRRRPLGVRREAARDVEQPLRALTLLTLEPLTDGRLRGRDALVHLRDQSLKLRHAHATELIEEGAALPAIQQQLGDANISTTSLYLHARPEALLDHMASRPPDLPGPARE